MIETNAKLNLALIAKRMVVLWLTPSDVAEALGVTTKTVGRWLEGDLPKAEALTRLAVLLSGQSVVRLDGAEDEALVLYDRRAQ